MANSERQNASFYAEVLKGHFIKGIFDLIGAKITRVHIHITKKSVSIRDDFKTQIMFDVQLPRKYFQKYTCTQERTISINLKHLQKILKNVKKKDSIAMFIRSNEKKFGLSVWSEGSSTNRREKIFIVFDDEIVQEQTATPEEYYGSEIYHYPINITSSEFQKIKKLVTMSQEMTVRMLGEKHITFSCDNEVYSDEISFGDLDSDFEDDDYVGEESESEAEESESEGEESEAEGDESEEEDGDEEENKNVELYEAKFYMSLLSLLIKVPALSSTIRFFQPMREGIPIKVESDIGVMGDVKIYIKDIKQIEYEETMKHNTYNIEGGTGKKSKK